MTNKVILPFGHTLLIGPPQSYAGLIGRYLCDEYEGKVVFKNLATELVALSLQHPWIDESHDLLEADEDYSILTAASWGPSPEPNLKEAFRTFDAIWRCEASPNLAVKLTQVKPATGKSITFKGTEAVDGINWRVADNEPAFGSAEYIRKAGLHV